MKFTGKNLLVVKYGLTLALDELHNLIATCPDVITYAEDIKIYEEDKLTIQSLLDKITISLSQEKVNHDKS